MADSKDDFHDAWAHWIRSVFGMPKELIDPSPKIPWLSAPVSFAAVELKKLTDDNLEEYVWPADPKIGERESIRNIPFLTTYPLPSDAVGTSAVDMGTLSKEALEQMERRLQELMDRSFLPLPEDHLTHITGGINKKTFIQRVNELMAEGRTPTKILCGKDEFFALLENFGITEVPEGHAFTVMGMPCIVSKSLKGYFVEWSDKKS